MSRNTYYVSGAMLGAIPATKDVVTASKAQPPLGTCTCHRAAGGGAACSTPEMEAGRDYRLSAGRHTEEVRFYSPFVWEYLRRVPWKFMRLFPVLMFVFKTLFQRRLQVKTKPTCKDTVAPGGVTSPLFFHYGPHCLGQGGGVAKNMSLGFRAELSGSQCRHHLALAGSPAAS